jgi:hypothetical protein
VLRARFPRTITCIASKYNFLVLLIFVVSFTVWPLEGAESQKRQFFKNEGPGGPKGGWVGCFWWGGRVAYPPTCLGEYYAPSAARPHQSLRYLFHAFRDYCTSTQRTLLTILTLLLPQAPKVRDLAKRPFWMYRGHWTREREQQV